MLKVLNVISMRAAAAKKYSLSYEVAFLWTVAEQIMGRKEVLRENGLQDSMNCVVRDGITPLWYIMKEDDEVFRHYCICCYNSREERRAVSKLKLIEEEQETMAGAE